MMFVHLFGEIFILTADDGRDTLAPVVFCWLAAFDAVQMIEASTIDVYLENGV
jgi:hypothetical protein